MKRAILGLGAGLALAFVLGGCGSGGVPDNVPRVKTGGTRVITQNTAEPITSGERLGNALQPAVVSQSGTAPIAGNGNDLTGAAGFQVVGDSDFIGVDEIDDFDNPQAVANFGSNLQNFGAGFAVPGTGAAGAGAVNTGATTSTTTTRSTTNDTSAAGTGSTTTTTTTTRSTTNGQ